MIDSIMTTLSSGVVLAAALLGFLVLAALLAVFVMWIVLGFFNPQEEPEHEPSLKRSGKKRYRFVQRNKPAT